MVYPIINSWAWWSSSSVNVGAIRNQHHYVINYISAKSGKMFLKKKKKYSWHYRNREQYLVMPVLYMELIFEFAEDFRWKGLVPMIFLVSTDRNWSCRTLCISINKVG